MDDNKVDADFSYKLEPFSLPLSQQLDQKFNYLHREVMVLMDETSRYHHEKEKAYQSKIACFYLRQMRQLSTRLYQIATLLMLRRAEREGDMKSEDVARESAKITLELFLPEADNPAWREMGESFCYLNRRSLELAWQVQHLLSLTEHQGENAPHQQLRKIEAAFIKSTSCQQEERA